MIRSFSCKNFRNVFCEDLEFGKINILIGANNAGKSNFIRALSFAANMVSNSKAETTGFLSELKRNGWNTAVDRHAHDSSFRFVWNLELLKGRSVVYTLCANAGKRRDENYIAEESLDSSEAREGALVPYNFLNLPEHNGISMLAIDEPEMNLHPAWQKLLAKEILRCQSFKQCFISTHSPDFLDEFTDGFLLGEVGIFVFDPLSRIPLRKLDIEEMRQELGEWTLGDLYRIGDPMIGGWPQ